MCIQHEQLHVHMLFSNQQCFERTKGLKQYRDLQVHDHTLVHLLPQVSPEDLDQGDLEGGDLAVHEDASQIQLHLETHINIGTVDGGGVKRLLGIWFRPDLCALVSFLYLHKTRLSQGH